MLKHFDLLAYILIHIKFPKVTFILCTSISQMIDKLTTTVE